MTNELRFEVYDVEVDSLGYPHPSKLVRVATGGTLRVWLNGASEGTIEDQTPEDEGRIVLVARGQVKVGSFAL